MTQFGRTIVTYLVFCAAVWALRADWSASSIAEAAQSSVALPSDLAYIGVDGNMWVVSVQSNKGAPITPSGRVFSFAWSPDGRQLVIARGSNACEGGTCPVDIVVRDAETGSEKTAMRGILDTTSNIAWSPDGTQLAFLLQGTIPTKRELKVLNLRNGQQTTIRTFDSVRAFSDTPYDTAAITWSPDGQRLISSEYPLRGEIISVGDWKSIAPLDGLARPRWSPDGAHIAGWRRQGNVPALSISGPTGRILKTLTIEDDDDAGVGPFAWSPDGQLMAIAGPSGVWSIDWQTGKQVRVTNERAFEPAWSPDGRWLAFSRLWEINEMGPLPRGIAIVRSNGSGLTDLGDGVEPAWRPRATRIQLPSDLVSSKQKSIAALSDLRADFLDTCEVAQFDIPTRSYDESAASSLIEDLTRKSSDGRLVTDDISGLQRLDLFESALVHLHTYYVTSAEDISESVGEGVVLTFSLVNTIDLARRVVINSPGVKQQINKLLDKAEEKAFDALDDSTQSLVYTISDPDLRRSTQGMTGCLVQLVEVHVRSGDAIPDWFTDEVGKTAGSELLTFALVGATQPAVDDATSKAKFPASSLRGTLVDAEQSVANVLKASDERTEAAHTYHTDIMALANIPKTIAALADIASMITSPSGVGFLIAQATSLVAKVYGDAFFISSAVNSAQTLMTVPPDVFEADRLAFDPRVAAVPQLYSSAGRAPILTSSALATHSNIPIGNRDELAKMDQRTDEYNNALDQLIAALKTEDPNQIEAAVDRLIGADQALTSQFRVVSAPITAAASARRPNNQSVFDTIYVNWSKAQLQWDLQSLALFAYLIDNVAAPKDAAARDNTERQVEMNRATIASYQAAVVAGLSLATGEIPQPIVVITSVEALQRAPLNTSFAITATVANAGTAPSQRITVTANGDTGMSLAESSSIATLQPGESRSVTFRTSVVSAGTHELVITVNTDSGKQVVRRKWIESVGKGEDMTPAPGLESRRLARVAAALMVCGGFAVLALTGAFTVRSLGLLRKKRS